jgi:hypothetical protein
LRQIAESVPLHRDHTCIGISDRLAELLNRNPTLAEPDTISHTQFAGETLESPTVGAFPEDLQPQAGYLISEKADGANRRVETVTLFY